MACPGFVPGIQLRLLPAVAFLDCRGETVRPPGAASDAAGLYGSEAFAHHRLTLCPQGIGTSKVESIAAHAFADRTDHRVIRDDLADMAILAVARDCD